MIGLWFLGDFGRLCYYIFAKQPFQFILGGIMTVLMDTVVLLQFFWYKNNDIDEEIDESRIKTYKFADDDIDEASIETEKADLDLETVADSVSS